MTRVVVLGGGPAGVGAAWRLREQRRADVVLFQRNADIGVYSGSFEWAGHRRDYGSHIPDLIDQPMNGATLLRLSAAAFVAVRRWEPRVRVTALRFGVGAVAGQLTAAIDVALVDSGTRQTLNIAIGTR